MTCMAERLWISQGAFWRMVSDAIRWSPCETGGMLLGYEADNGEAVVTDIVGPGPRARHGRFRFRPDADHQQAELEARYTRTDGRETYLGDWHTHPTGSSAPSILDKRTLARIARTASSRTTRPIMVILSSNRESWVPGAIRFQWNERKFFLSNCLLTQLSPLIFGDPP